MPFPVTVVVASPTETLTLDGPDEIKRSFTKLLVLISTVPCTISYVLITNACCTSVLHDMHDAQNETAPS